MNISSLVQPITGKQLTVTLVLSEGALPDATPYNTVKSADGIGRPIVLQNEYHLHLSMTEILGIEAKHDFIPTSEQHGLLGDFVTDLFKLLAKTAKTEVIVSYTSGLCHSVVIINGRNAKGLSMRLIIDCLKGKVK